MKRALIRVGARADDHGQRGNTMFNYGYMCYQAERAKTQAEQRDADAQLGQLFAEVAQLRHTSIKAVYEVAARFWPSRHSGRVRVT
jgi:hypothetical protein